MTVGEKRNYIREFCKGKNCDECPLENLTKNHVIRCYRLTDEMILMLYQELTTFRSAPVNTCVSCGAVIPEGRQVCPTCEANDTVEPDPITPEYYNDTKIAPIDVIEDWGLDFCLGSALKYIKRAGKKDNNPSVQDLNKVIWYVKRRIQELEEASK